MTLQIYKQFFKQQIKNEKKMEVDVLEKAQSVYAQLTEVKRQQKIFTQNSPDFAAKHWSYPWCMLTDDEWDELSAKIKGRFTDRIAELEKEFAAL